MRSILVAVMIFASASVAAFPVTWTLSDFEFNDGGTANGTFVMDSDNGYISAVNIYTTDGVAFVGDVYDSLGAGVPNEEFFPGYFIQFFTDNYPGQTNETAFVLFTGSDFLLEDATGGTYSMNGAEYTCINEDPCNANFVELRTTNSIGMGNISAVPVPAAVWLFGSALAGLGWLRRRKTV
jgi:hypothetical protein